MKMTKTKFTALCLSLVGSSLAHASRITETQSFENTNCLENLSCDLESFYIKTISDQAKYQGRTFMSAGFKTVDNSALKNYAIVQFHQGCMYKKESEIKLLTRTYMGVEGVPFIHPEMVVDSGGDADPIYQSSPRGGQDDGFGYIFPRKEFYFINAPQFLEATGAQDSYMNNLDNPEVRELHISDVPTFADTSANITASLNFVTCLYKIKDVPQFLDNPTRDNLPGAIKCFEWNHNWKTNNDNNLERTTEIDSVCLQGEKK